MAKQTEIGLSWITRKLLFGLGAAAMLLFIQAAPDPVPARDPAATPVSASADEPVRIAARAAHPQRPDSVAAVDVRSELAIERWLQPGEYAWNDENVPPGPAVVVVNLRARVLSVYRGGVEIGRSSIIYGADNKPTPTGTFPILEKDADHYSNLYDNAPMPHMLRLTWDGVAIHGSDALADDLATRGCVGLPREFAELLFAVADIGGRVVIWSGEPTAA